MGRRVNITLGQLITLAVEVISTNWRGDYLVKLTDYETCGIQEYWIVDYLGIGDRRSIGSPNQPTFTICNLLDGEHEMQQFRTNDAIVSPTFPDLKLAVDPLFNS